jgi:putative chitinase
MTPLQLAAVMNIPLARAMAWAVPITEAMDEFGIDTPERQAAFLAQIGHESGRMRYTREIWGPTSAQVRYEGRADLGNIQPGDGKKFMGRGLIQITGRANYNECGIALGLPLCEQTELLEQPTHAARSAAWFWKSRNLNRFADSGDFVALTRRVNGGTNGLADREKLWIAAKDVLGVA